MAFYDFSRGTQLGGRIGRVVDALAIVLREGAAAVAEMAQMTDEQVIANAGVTAITGSTALQQAQGLKAEFTSDIGKLTTNSSQSNVNTGLNQLLAQTGG